MAWPNIARSFYTHDVYNTCNACNHVRLGILTASNPDRVPQHDSIDNMEFKDLRYTVKVSVEGKAAGPLDKLKGSTRDRDLLHDVSGSVNPGSVLAILGPSGRARLP